MVLKKILLASALGLLLVPLTSSALVLSPSGQAQLSQLSLQLVAIFTQISQAQALGTAYLQSPTFQTQAAQWTTQLTQIQTQLVTLLAANTQAPSIPSSTITSASGCPNASRTLGPGMQGSDVAELQLFLSKNPYTQYTGAISGYYDQATVEAMQRYQSYYSLVSYGTPETTGYGQAGPATRASILALCSGGSYGSAAPIVLTTPLQTVPPIYQPTTPVTTVQTNYSTGQLSIIPSLTGNSGGANSVTFTVNMLPNSTCTSAAFVLSFGDGQEQSLSSNPSCGNQIVQIPHNYPTAGAYTATLSSGAFQTSLQIQAQAPVANNSVTLTATQSQNVSYGANITVTYNPGTTCVGGAYTLSFGDTASQSLSFSSGCSTQTQTIQHTYPGTGPYLLSAADAQGHAFTASFTGIAIASAGAGDPYQVLLMHGDGANNSTAITDSSPKAHAFSINGAARIDTAAPKVGTGAILFSGASSISTAASEDFNFGNGPFTLDFWLAPGALPATDQQAAIVMQASQNAADTSLGGIGLELFGSKLYFVGRIGDVTYHPFYNNSIHTDVLTANTWYHVALVRSGNSLNLYLNGTSTGAMVVTGATNPSSNALTFGRYGEFNGNYFTGRIDEVNLAKGVARWTGNFNVTTRQQNH
jgi:peptidoglycan hydrolase-like protein with peptidoglycan-binding domain